METLIAALRRSGNKWEKLSRSKIEEMIGQSDKKRFELAGDYIRALYGHSLPGKLKRMHAKPPAMLFHGTSQRAAEEIMREGLKPMGRQYVHLSVDRETAEQVGRRKSAVPIILKIAAAAAYTDGIVFYAGNDKVWLADLYRRVSS